MKVLILAAGRGTRISRYLSGKPKCTVDIGGGQCLIEYTIDLLHSRGIQDIGIVLGYENNRFGPDDDVTREQLAAILYRYAQYKGYDVTAGGSGVITGVSTGATSVIVSNGTVSSSVICAASFCRFVSIFFTVESRMSFSLARVIAT